MPQPRDLAWAQTPPSVRPGRAADAQAALLALGPARPGSRAGRAYVGPTGLLRRLGPAVASSGGDKGEPKSKGRRVDRCAFRGTALAGAPGLGAAARRAPPVRERKGGRRALPVSAPPGAGLSPAAASSWPGWAKVKGLRRTLGPGTPTPRTCHPPVSRASHVRSIWVSSSRRGTASERPPGRSREPRGQGAPSPPPRPRSQIGSVFRRSTVCVSSEQGAADTVV